MPGTGYVAPATVCTFVGNKETGMQRVVKVFLRLALGVGFLSAVADRFGWWPSMYSAWGDMDTFMAYTAQLAPWLPGRLLPVAGWSVTVAEGVLGLCLIIGFKTRHVAFWSGILLLLFALSMAFYSGMKAPLDASVFTASAAAFALSTMREKVLEWG